MLPLISFETGRSTQIQSSGQPEKAAPANGSLVLSEYRNHGREANTRGEESERIYTRAPPKRVGRAFALLTKTYHGSRIIGKLATTASACSRTSPVSGLHAARCAPGPE